MNYEEIPALTPPEGVVPSFLNPPKHNGFAHVVLATCLVLPTTAIIFRLCSRIFVVRSVFLADILLVASYALYIPQIVMGYRVAHSPGYFVHQWDVNLAEIVPYLHTTFVGVNIYCAFMILIKSAILVEWLRVFIPRGAPRTALFYTIHLVLWVNVLYYTIMLIVQNLACTPYAYSWDRTIPGGACTRFDPSVTGQGNRRIGLSGAVVNFITDLCILVIPQRVIWRLSMSPRKRLGLAVLFVIGLLAVISGACRLALTVPTIDSQDYVYDFGPLILCCLGEGACGILVICGPTIPKVLEVAMGRIPSSVRARLGLPVTKQGGEGNVSNKQASGGYRTGSRFGTPRARAYANMEDQTFEFLDRTAATMGQGQGLAEGEGGGGKTGRFEIGGQVEMGTIIRRTEIDITTASIKSSDELSDFRFA